MRIECKRFLVTGATRGIGRALTRQLVAQGATVVAVARDGATLTALAADLGPAVEPLPCDLADRAARDMMLTGIGPLDGVINNAAIQFETDYPTAEAPRLAEDMALEVAVNFEAPLHIAAALLPKLANQPEAVIVNVTSALALAPKQSAPVYCATKAGLRSFTDGLRYQTQDTCPQVRVCEVVMALVETDMTAGRGRGKISAEDAATAVLSGIARDRNRVWVGKTRALRVLHRLSPALVARILRRG